MKRFASVCGLVAALTLGVVGTARGQDDAAKKNQQAAEAAKERDQAKAQAARADLQRLVPLSVDVLVTRYQGDKKISSMPYMLAVNANKLGQAGPALLRMGAKVPVPTIAAPPGNPGGPAGPMPGPVNYQDIGTNIAATRRWSTRGSSAHQHLGYIRLREHSGQRRRPSATCQSSVPAVDQYARAEGWAEPGIHCRHRPCRVIRISVTLRVVK